MVANGDDPLLGDLMKVVYLDEDSGIVFFRLSDGRTARFTGIEKGTLVRNDVILSYEGGWTKVPQDVWPTSSLTSVIREVLTDGTVLGESGSAVLTLGNPKNIKIEPNCTVEIDGTSQIVRVISPDPIRVRPHGLESEIDASAYLVKPKTDGLSFDDFGGYPSVVASAKELIETQLNYRDKLTKIGARPVKGVLFTGPPGTGKTHLARIIANESKADFYDISGPSIVSKWVGDSEDTLRKIFDHAAKSKTGKAIIFFDEIDSIAESRTGDTHESSRRLVAQLLTLMDGFDNSQSSTIIVAATNRVEALDAALTRPGRFDWEIEFGLPEFQDRIDILRVGAKRVRCKDDLPIIDLAIRTHNWSAAQLSLIWTEAALVAALDQRQSIAAEDMAQAYERVARRPTRSEQ